MNKNYFDITLALAGICQSAYLVQQLAHYGKCDEKYFYVMLQSMVDLDPPSLRSIYGDSLENLKIGLETLIGFISYSSHDALSTELKSYTFRLMVLERKLNRNREGFVVITQRINNLNRQLIHSDLLSTAIISYIAAIYIDIISPLGPRIKVTGKLDILQNNLIQDKVRAALLAGIRSAVLWKQVGGGRLQLMFKRRCLLSKAKQMLSINNII